MLGEDQSARDERLRDLLADAVARTPCDAILFSGGLDTSIVAALARARHPVAVTVVVGDDAPDLPFARSLAADLGLEHVVLRRSLDDLLASMPQVVSILGTFDGMFLRNDTVIYEGLRALARRGFRSCWTGDGADELFAGYSFVFTKPVDEIERLTRHFARTMHFNGPRLGAVLGVEVRSPYLDPAVIAYAVARSGAELVLEHDGTRLGKAPLRRAFATLLPATHAYRRKDPIEIGSGATALKDRLSGGDPDTVAADIAKIAREDRVVIRDAEHLAYYRMYRAVHGGPPRPDPAMPKECPDCHARGPDGTYCTVCGAYPI